MASPYNYVWNLREGIRKAAEEASIAFIAGGYANDDPMPSLATTALGTREIPPSSVWTYIKERSFLKKVYKTFLDGSSRRKLSNHVCFLNFIDHMTVAFGRFDDQLEMAKTIHVFSTIDALRIHNYLVGIHKRHHVKLILSFYTPGWPARDWVRSCELDGFFPSATRKLLRAHGDADEDAIRVADVLVFPSPESLDGYAEDYESFPSLIKIKDVRFVEFGTDPLRPTVPASDVRQRLGYADKFVVSYIGQHSAFCGYDQVKRVGARFLRRNADVAYVIAGRQKPRVGLDDVRWTECGFTKEMDNLIQASDVFVSAHRQVYFNVHVLEAMSRGRLVVASRIGWHRRLENVSSGVKLFSTDEEMLEALEAMRSLSPVDRAAAEAENRQVFESSYTAEAFAQRYLAMVEDVQKDYRLVWTDTGRTGAEAEKTPEISIIIPVYNVEKYLDECLKSVICQTFEDLEIIAINNGCTDGSAAILSRYAAQDARIKIIDIPVNVGMARARNAGLDAARGKYIAFADSDDRLEPEMLQQLHHSCVSKDVLMSTCAFSFLNGPAKKTYFHSTFMTNEARLKYFKSGIIDLSDHRVIGLLFLVVWNALYHRSIFDTIRYQQTYDDLPTTVQILSKQRKIGHIPKSLYLYRVDNPGRIVLDASTRILDIFHIMDIIRSVLFDVMKKREARKTYLLMAIRAIHYRASLKMSRPLRFKFWKRSMRFFREEGLNFKSLMELSGGTISQADMLPFYRFTVVSRYYQNWKYSVGNMFRRFTRSMLRPLIEGNADIVAELRIVENMLNAETGRVFSGDEIIERVGDVDRTSEASDA